MHYEEVKDQIPDEATRNVDNQTLKYCERCFDSGRVLYKDLKDKDDFTRSMYLDPFKTELDFNSSSNSLTSFNSSALYLAALLVALNKEIS